jgi:hypothetical protein
LEQEWRIQEITLAGPIATLATGNGYIPLDKLGDFFWGAQSCMPRDYKSDLAKLRELFTTLDKMTKSNTPLDTPLDLLLCAYRDHNCSDPGIMYTLSSIFPNPKGSPSIMPRSLHICIGRWLNMYIRSDISNPLSVPLQKVFNAFMTLADEDILKRWKELGQREPHDQAVRLPIRRSHPNELRRVKPCDSPAGRRIFKQYLLGPPKFSLGLCRSKIFAREAGRPEIHYGSVQPWPNRHPSTLSDDPEFTTYGLNLGDYFIGSVVDASPLPASNYETQHQSFTNCAAMILYSLDSASAPFRDSTSQ